MNDDTPVQTPPTGLISPADFTTFMRNYQDMVFTTAARLTGNDAQAEDISQEVFLKAYEHFDMLQTSPTAGGWLKTVATNLSLNHLSRYRNRWKFFSEFRKDNGAADAKTPDVDFAAPDTFFCRRRRRRAPGLGGSGDGEIARAPARAACALSF